MQVGISLTSVFAVSDPRDGARYMIERARGAERAGLDSLFVGDHHVTPVPYYQNSAILGRLLAEWRDRPAGALYLLPLWHPVLLAEQVGTLASIAQGRFIMQCAIGPGDSQFPAMGIDPRQRPSRFEESLDVLRRLWAGEKVSHQGRYSFEGARISPTPPEPISVWIGAIATPAIERAARLGDGWLASPHLTPEQARQQCDLYTESCARQPRPLGSRAIRRDVYVGESAEEADATGGAVVRAGYRGFPPGAPVVGNIEQVASAFLELAGMGYQQIVVRNLVSDQSEALRSIERLAEVREIVRDA